MHPLIFCYTRHLLFLQVSSEKKKVTFYLNLSDILLTESKVLIFSEFLLEISQHHSELPKARGHL